MPRIPTSVIIKAYRQNHLLPLLLQECRTISSAQNELRWLRERAVDVNQSADRRHLWTRKHPASGWKSLLRSMCRARSKGMPLQYILGDQPFGDLEILCKSGVLIPRPETESYTLHIAKLLISKCFQASGYMSAESPALPQPLRIIDLCTGTGCISLLLHALLAPHFQRLFVLGVDLSPAAIKLAKRNLEHNIRLGLLSHRSRTEIHFHQGDVLGHNNDDIPRVEEILEAYVSSICRTGRLERSKSLECDILVSNPPYISSTSFWDGTTARSVRAFEPKLALVPPANMNLPTTGTCKQEDIFYHHLIALSFKLSTKLTVLECGSRKQGARAAALCKASVSKLHEDHLWSVDIWPDVKADQYVNEYDRGDGACAVILQKKPTM